MFFPNKVGAIHVPNSCQTVVSLVSNDHVLLNYSHFSTIVFSVLNFNPHCSLLYFDMLSTSRPFLYTCVRDSFCSGLLAYSYCTSL